MSAFRVTSPPHEEASNKPREEEKGRRERIASLSAATDRGEGTLAFNDPLEELPRIAFGEALLPLWDVMDIGVDAASSFFEIHTLFAARTALSLWLSVGAAEQLTPIADPSRGDPSASICGYQAVKPSL